MTLSFRLKTIIGVALIEGVLLLLLVLTSISYLRDSNEIEIRNRAQTAIQLLADLTRDSILSMDLARLESVADQAISAPDVVYVRIMDADRTLVEIGEAAALARPFAEDRTLGGVQDGTFDISVYMEEAGLRYGRVELGFSVARAGALFDNAIQKLSGIAMLEMALVGLFSFMLGAYLTRELKQLRDAALLIGGGEMGTQLPVRGKDEIAQACQAFNTMSAQLAQYQQNTEENIRRTKALATRLSEQELKLSTILQTAVDGFIVIDGTGIIDDINPAACKLFGYHRNTLIGKNVSCLMPAPYRHEHDGYLQRYLQLGDPRIIGIGREVTGMHQDGSTFPMDLSVNEMTVGGARMFVGLVRDLRDRKRIEHEARRNEALKSAVIDANLDALVTIDIDDRIIEFSARAEQIFGYPRAQALGKSMPDLIVPPAMRAAHRQGMAHLLATGEGPILGQRIEVEAFHASGETFPVELTVQAIDIDGERLFTAFVRDISDRKQAEMNLREAKAQAEAASEAKSHFLAAMSHEIRTPLNGVVGTIDLLSHSPLRPSQQEMISTALDSATQLQIIIDDILDFSKIEAGKLELENVAVNLESLMEKLAGNLLPLAIKGHVEFLTYCDPDLPEVMGDPVRLRQILANLTGNAIKFTKTTQDRQGQILLRITQEQRPPAAPSLCIQVSDNGIGMSEAVQRRLFQPFTQGDEQITRQYGGTGLGLVITRRLVGLMQGEVVVESQEDRGSTFTVRLPLKAAAGSPPEPSSPLAGLTVFLFKKRSDAAWLLESYLEHAGAEVTLLPADPLPEWELKALTGAKNPLVIIDSQGDGGFFDSLQQHLRDHAPDLDPRIILIERGRRRFARALEGRGLKLDLNAVRRRHLLNVVAQVAGRELPFEDLSIFSDERRDQPDHEVACKAHNILLVDDNETNLKVIGRQLDALGYSVVTAEHGEQALSLLAEQSFSLLLTDCHMPHMDGYELARRIRDQEPEGVHLPIIAITADALKGTAQQCYQAGMDHYLTKPLQLHELREALRTWLPDSAPAAQEAISEAESPPTDADDESVMAPWALGQLLGTQDPVELAGYYRDFLNTASQTAQALEAAYGEGDSSEVSRLAHKLKSSASTVGAHSLAEVCLHLETSGKEGDGEALEQQMSRFSSLFERVTLWVEQFCQLAR